MVGRHRNSRRGPSGTGKPDPAKDRAEHEAARGPGKKAKRNLKRPLNVHLSRLGVEDVDLGESVDELNGASDRACAIMGASMIESCLLLTISNALEDASDKNALFYDESGPFRSFKNRVVAGRAMGLFDAKIATDLDLIRDIRNQFAHALLKLDFDNEHIGAVCERISDYDIGDDGRDIGGNRRRFEDACWGISYALLDKSNEIRQEKTAKKPRNELGLSDLVAASLQSGSDNALGNLLSDEAGVRD